MAAEAAEGLEGTAAGEEVDLEEKTLAASRAEAVTSDRQEGALSHAKSRWAGVHQMRIQIRSGAKENMGDSPGDMDGDMCGRVGIGSSSIIQLGRPAVKVIG